MNAIGRDAVLQEALWQAEGTRLWIKRAVLVVAGVAALAIAAKAKVFLGASPVPMNFGTFALLTIGAAYGARLGLVTVLAYMAIGALGYDVFASSSAEKNGLVYMMGGTGGYLVGYVLAAMALGVFARKGWDRNVALMALGLLIGNALIYVPGLLWLNTFAESWSQTLAWGLTPFLLGDGLKLALAAILVPSLWKFVGLARG